MSEKSLASTGALQIAGCRVEPSTLRVVRDGRETRLESKAMQVLVYLAERVGQVVSRAELEERLWPGRIVTEDSVTTAIAKLRRALGDNARRPRIVETVPKSGYRLIADVVAADEHPLPHGKPLPSQPPSGKPSLIRHSGRAILGAVMLGLLAIIFRVSELDEFGAPDRSRPTAARPSVAVLPLENLGESPDEDYFANGITADLITDLSKVEGLLVIAPGSVFAYESGDARPRKVAADLDVAYVVVGSVQRLGDRLRINTQLIEASKERALWGERFNGSINDLFDIQDKIADAVIAALQVELAPAERASLAERPTASVLAYDYYLRGFEEHGTRNDASNRAARNHFQKAIDIDPGFARAYAGLALTYSREAIDGWTPTPSRSLELAADYARTASSMDPSVPQVHFVTGQVELFQGRHLAAVESARRAIEADPNYADAYALQAWVLSYSGRPREALSSLQIAMRLNPRPPASYLEILGEIQFVEHAYDDSAATFRRVLYINPGYTRARLWNAAALARAGSSESASWEVLELLAETPSLSLGRLQFSFPFRDIRMLEELMQGLRMAGLPE